MKFDRVDLCTYNSNVHFAWNATFSRTWSHIVRRRIVEVSAELARNQRRAGVATVRRRPVSSHDTKRRHHSLGTFTRMTPIGVVGRYRVNVT